MNEVPNVEWGPAPDLELVCRRLSNVLGRPVTDRLELFGTAAVAIPTKSLFRRKYGFVYELDWHVPLAERAHVLYLSEAIHSLYSTDSAELISTIDPPDPRVSDIAGRVPAMAKGDLAWAVPSRWRIPSPAKEIHGEEPIMFTLGDEVRVQDKALRSFGDDCWIAIAKAVTASRRGRGR